MHPHRPAACLLLLAEAEWIGLCTVPVASGFSSFLLDWWIGAQDFSSPLSSSFFALRKTA
jgi:hypothetical protein